MYTAYIGKRLIECVNRRDGTDYTPKAFFDDIFFPCFFASERYLMHANNSPVDQASKQKGKTPLTAAVLRAKCEEIHDKIKRGEADASIFLGGPSSKPVDSTSGQVTNLTRGIHPDEIYCSWFGAALGVGVEGGFYLLIDADEVLLALLEGWRQYRQLIDQTPNLKGLQVQTWNGQWLTLRFGQRWNPAIAPTWATDKDGGALTTQPWARLLFALCNRYRDAPERTIIANVFALGQTNRTIGFVRLNLPQVRRLSDLYDQLFNVPEGMPAKAFENLYETDFGFKKACQFAEIGLRALQPKDMRDYLDGKKSPNFSDKPEGRLLFQTQETWITAMLNNKELITRAEEIARALTEASKQERGKVSKLRQAQEALAAKTRREFIEKLTDVLESDGANATLFNQAVEEIAVMPMENVPLFLTLVRFKYAYLQRKPGQTTTSPINDKGEES